VTVSAATILAISAHGWAAQGATRCEIPLAHPSAAPGWFSPDVAPGAGASPGTGGQGGGGPAGPSSPAAVHRPGKDPDWRNDTFKDAGCKAWRRMHGRASAHPPPAPSATAAVKP
jgi:hypothetical protein